MLIKASFSNVANVLLDWDDVHNDDFCSWRGIFCDNISLSVVSLNLSNLNLGGELSPAIGDLKNLLSVDLEGNKLTGQIPDEIANCLSLTLLDLSDNLLNYGKWGPGYYDCRFGIVAPGGEIPEWFGYQNSGGELFMQLPPDGYVKNFRGLAVCFVSEFTTAQHIRVHIKLGAPDGIKLGKSFCILFHHRNFKFSSEHVWLGYVSAESFNDLTQPEDCCLLELCIRKACFDEGEFRIKNCAARLVYEEDTNVSAEAVVEHNDGAEVSGSGSCDDDDDNDDNVDNDDDVDGDIRYPCYFHQAGSCVYLHLSRTSFSCCCARYNNSPTLRRTIMGSKRAVLSSFLAEFCLKLSWRFVEC
ncbi:hypothetical protein F0562_008030 [Nyssa sinensis]|uniref:Uncharacterized protein n=1 Tax=Nyssa sinensis TaxID=561372 RepID=A0A5J5AAA3_9ASTE|nr:hypothetical protein F0562_008030 [Nyssa sinensis]